MHTFLFASSPDPAVARLATTRALETSARVFDPIFGPLEQKRDTLIEPGHQACWFSSLDSGRADLISHYTDRYLATLVYGEVWSAPDVPPAETVAHAWRRGGGSEIRHLRGSFGALIFDLNENTFVLIHDITAQRRLYYFYDQNILLVSPHDCMLASSGMCPTTIDTSAIASALQFGWSLSGRSFLQFVYSVPPHSLVKIKNNQINNIADGFISRETRLARRDHSAIDRHIETIFESMSDNLQHLCANDGVVRIELSAGADSRAVFGVARHALQHSSAQIVAICSGGADSVDRQVAQDIAFNYGVDFQAKDGNASAPDDFLLNCKKIAFANNGDSNARTVALSPDNDHNIMRLHGNGGEICRGYYYPFRLEKRLTSLSKNNAKQLLKQKFFKKQLIGLSNESVQALLKNFDEELNLCAELGESGCDLLDLFYAYERNAVWGQHRARNTWRKLYGPFNDPALMRAIFQLPSPIGFPPHLHKFVVRRHVSKMYWRWINDAWLLPWQSERVGFRILEKLHRKISVAIPGSGRTDDVMDIAKLRNLAFAGALHPLLVDVVKRSSPIWRTLVDEESLQKLLVRDEMARSTVTS